MIIAISGLPGSGKDEIGMMLQFFSTNPKYTTYLEYKQFKSAYYTLKDFTTYEIKKIAEPLKQCACIILGCTMKQLESQEFKASKLPEKWNVYKQNKRDKEPETVSMTVREFLQIFGTEVGRVLHPNTWVNSLIEKYQSNWIITDLRYENEYEVLKSIEPNLITLKVTGRGVDNGHSSNHGMDSHKFNWTINNNNTLEELFKEVKFFKETFIDGCIKQEK